MKHPGKFFAFILLLHTAIYLPSCISKKIFLDLQSQFSNMATHMNSVAEELSTTKKSAEELQNKLKQLGSVTIENELNEEETRMSKAIFKSNNWFKENNADYYKDDLLSGLGKIWLKTDSGWVEGGVINSGEFSTEQVIRDKGTTVFEHFCDRNFNAEIDAFRLIRGKLNGDCYVKLLYQINGTSELKILQDNLQKIASKYSRSYSDKKIKGVFLCTGYHVKNLECIKYNKITAGAGTNTPFINVNGEFYSEDKTKINSWEVYRQLVDLSLFFVPVKKDSVTKEIFTSLPTGKTIYQTLKSTTKSRLTDEDILMVMNFPELLKGENLDSLTMRRNIILDKTQKEKLARISDYLNSVKKSADIIPENEN